MTLFWVTRRGWTSLLACVWASTAIEARRKVRQQLGLSHKVRLSASASTITLREVA
jgi:hypothetical protein